MGTSFRLLLAAPLLVGAVACFDSSAFVEDARLEVNGQNIELRRSWPGVTRYCELRCGPVYEFSFSAEGCPIYRFDVYSEELSSAAAGTTFVIDSETTFVQRYLHNYRYEAQHSPELLFTTFSDRCPDDTSGWDDLLDHQQRVRGRIEVVEASDEETIWDVQLQVKGAVPRRHADADVSLSFRYVFGE